MRLTEVAKLAEPPTGSEAVKLQAQINRGKKRSKRLAEGSAVLGFGALALRAPQAANALARRSKRLAATPAVKRLGSMAPHATKWSEASVPLSIGTGAVGSLNYARLQGKENKLNKPVIKGMGFTQPLKDIPKVRKRGRLVKTGRVKSWTDEQPGFVKRATVAVDSRGQAKVLHMQPTGQAGVGLRATDIKPGGTAFSTRQSPGSTRPGPSLRKSDDRFLRENRDRISPSAEAGYEYLRRGRNTARRQSAVSGAVTAGNLLGAGYYVKKKNPMMAGAASLLAVGSGANAVDRGLMAHRWNKNKMGPIKAKAISRREAGLYAPGRGKQPVDTTSRSKARKADLSKALWKMPVASIKPSVRPGGLMRLSSGRTVTRRGSIPGTGRRRF